MYQPRIYRNAIDPCRRTFFRVRVKETDLYIHTDNIHTDTEAGIGTGVNLPSLARDLILKYRSHIEEYIRQHPHFADSLIPFHNDGPAPAIVREMIAAGRAAGVGPMAAVAGAVAESVGRDLLSCSAEMIVENGGDIFIKSDRPLTVAVFAGKSPLSMKVGLKIDPGGKPIAVCTSSGTIGHSLSLGSADAVCVVSSSCSLADATATAIGNIVRTAADLANAAVFGKNIPGIDGVVVIKGDRLGAWGKIELVPVHTNDIKTTG